jgi:hypothetical protein
VLGGNGRFPRVTSIQVLDLSVRLDYWALGKTLTTSHPRWDFREVGKIIPSFSDYKEKLKGLT